uniref:Uncharacterized protein n=1 Tax=Lepeophtheirus salmonis TaxID=72036 RepID=A0A0K2VD24_LEPSM
MLTKSLLYLLVTNLIFIQCFMSCRKSLYSNTFIYL